MKITTIIGARPQFIKAATVSRAIAVHNATLSSSPSPIAHSLSPKAHSLSPLHEVIVHTGQHFDANMSQVFFDELEIPKPDYNLGIGGGTHGQNTGRMIEKIEEVLLLEQPDWVLAYGDTDSTLAGALATAKLHIPVAHVEAGLRSFNRRMPEEINRIVTDHIADLLFTPTDTATARLREEGISEDRIRQVGDVMYDAALYYGRLADERSDILRRHKLTSGEYALATIHRAENTDDPTRLAAIMSGLNTVAEHMPVILPLHPRTRKKLETLPASNLSPIAHSLSPLTCIDPVGYLDMVALEKNAAVIATDSGGVQKEAYFHGVPCVTLRDETEWVELVEMGWNRLVQPGVESVAEAVTRQSGTTGISGSPYGDGRAARRIIQFLTGSPT